MNKTLRPIIDELRLAKTVLLLSHVSPDFDTAGSMLGLKLALEKAGKAVTAVNVSGLPENMMYMPGAESHVRNVHPRKKFDVTVALDANQPHRFGDIFETERSRARLGVVINVDHHLDGDDFATYYFTDSNRASTAELVVDLIRHYPIELDYDIALNLYGAIVSDTGGFRYSNTNPSAFAYAASLLDYGVNPWFVTTKLYENKPVQEIRLLADVLQTLELSPCGKIATLCVTDEMMQRHQAEHYMLDGFVNVGRSINGVEVAMFIKEQGPGVNRVSLRSKGEVNVAAIAKLFGGGGHHNAAGCTLQGDLESARQCLLKSSSDMLAKGMGGPKKKAAASKSKSKPKAKIAPRKAPKRASARKS